MNKKEEKIVEFFKISKEYFDSIRNFHKKHGGVAIEDEVLKLIFKNITENMKILDGGCGEGSITNFLAEKFPDVIFYGVDISDVGINYAYEESNKRKLKNVTYKVGDLKYLDFPDNYFDLIYSQSVIEHVVNYEKALKEFWRVLKPKGKLIIRVSNGGVEGKNKLKAIRDYIFGNNRLIELNPSLILDNELTRNFDVNSIPSDVLLTQLKRIGFKIIYFSTLRNHLRYNLSEVSFIKRIWRIFISLIPFFPFTHLGPTIVVMCQKR